MQKSLLFEDETYSLSQNYFWALQSLRIMNECISSMIASWTMHDKNTILSTIGESQSDTDAQLHSSSNGSGAPPTPRSTAQSILADIDQQMGKLADMIKDNNAKQEEIKSLRDGVCMSNFSLAMNRSD